MRRFILLTLLATIGLTAAAKPIDRQTAQIAGTHFLQKKGLIELSDTLTFYIPQGQEECLMSYYVFNYDTIGFVIVSADSRCTPIIGYSMNGSFDCKRIPENMRGWLAGMAEDIQKGIRSNAPENKEMQQLWNDLANGDFTPAPSPKSDEYLLTSTWEQGSGYNNYCPVQNGQHVVVGCVATAMAQIIRYHQYPTRGFGYKSYVHSAYGQQAVNFDTTEYNYSMMPDKIRRSTPSSQKDMVSRLCWHCGVVVNMNYQNSNHTSGSGAYTDNVPEGLMHFGYTDAECYSRDRVNSDSIWRAMILNEIDNLRPIEYSGYGSDGGHAFVLDGYNDWNEYHFNWGWGGYCDGFYTLSTMVGFTTGHQMVVNIKPSGWDGHLTHFLVSSNGHGDGTAWNKANSNISAAVKLNKLTSRDIWVKEGIYFGDTTDSYAYRFTATATILGGFAGTETAANQRNAKNHPVIFDGQGQRGIIYAHIPYSGSKQLKICDINLTNGYSEKNNVLSLSGGILMSRVAVVNCQSDSGCIASLSDCRLVATTFNGNRAPVICQMSDATIRQSLIANNDADAIHLGGSSRVVNCDIVSNLGVGAKFKHAKNSFVNNIVWNNDTNLSINAELNDTAFRHNAIEGDTVIADSINICLRSDNGHSRGPRFIQPTTARGYAGLDNSADWHLNHRSVCIDAGERLPESITDGDLDQSIRCRNGIIDMGCYESNYPVGIEDIDDPAISLYPNPADQYIAIEGMGNSTVSIYDIYGRMVLHSSDHRIDISTLASGLYLLRCGAFSHKFVKR